MKYAWIAGERSRFPVVRLCTLLEVSRSGFYAWQRRPASARARSDAQLVAALHASYAHHRGKYGRPRLTRDLREAGYRVNHKRVRRLMLREGLAAQRRRRFVRTTDSRHTLPVAPNLLERDFGASAPNQKWVTDITYVDTDEGWLYVALVMDLFSRRLVGWAMSDRRRIATEAALLGGLVAKGIHPMLAIVSDGAGQFDILEHGLCWVHTERLVHKLIPANAPQRAQQERVRDEIWAYYADLKAYRAAPAPQLSAALDARFDTLFGQQTGWATLDRLLRRIRQRKGDLLRVLARPDMALHTNASETDIRDYVKVRKISSGTRSELGRQCRDTFASLKKTCRKLGVSFWAYLTDRLTSAGLVPPLAELMRQRAA